MATPSGPIWPCDPHTRAKHQLLRRYLQAWFPILLSSYDTVTYAEGFAGPGVYTGGEPGSPVIACQEVSRVLHTAPTKNAQLVLVEADCRRLERLKHQISVAGGAAQQLEVTYSEGECADKLLPTLDAVGAFAGPIFAFLDSFGNPNIPFQILEAVASHNAGEILLTFRPQHLIRFGEDPEHQADGDRAFGGTHWRSVHDQPPQRKAGHLLDAYRRVTLRKAGFEFTLAFEMLDERNNKLYLIFGTRHRRGVEKMKEAMWNVDPHHGVRYRDPADPDQLALDIQPEPNTEPLRRAILHYIDSVDKGASVSELQDHILRETVFKPTQVLGVARRLIDAQELETQTPGRLSTRTFLTRPRYRTDTLF
jgi:three-Cys-motif partner protein